ncbi:hypothetical protein JW916_02245 [Candidatus Sumerlaeota bacterium]|nr:hypothetical protein [Candidatus Sumerlaeota bacterium]
MRARTLVIQSLDQVVVASCAVMAGALLLDKAEVPSRVAMPILIAGGIAMWAAWAWRRRKAIRGLGRRVLSARRRGALWGAVGVLAVCAASFRVRTPSYMTYGADILNYIAYARYTAFHWPVMRTDLWTDLPVHSLPIDTQAGLSSVLLGIPYYLGISNVWSVTLVCVVVSALMLLAVRAAMPARFRAVRGPVAFVCLLWATYALAPGPAYDKKFHVLILLAWLVARTRSRPRARAGDYAILFLAGLASMWMHAAATLSLPAAFGCWRLGAMVARRSLWPALEIVCMTAGVAVGFFLMGNADLASQADAYSGFYGKYGLGFGMLGKPTTDLPLEAARIAWSKIVAAHGSLKKWHDAFSSEATLFLPVVLGCVLLWAHSRRGPCSAVLSILACWVYLATGRWFVYPALYAVVPEENRHLLTAFSWSLIHLGRWLGVFLMGLACFAFVRGVWGFILRVQRKKRVSVRPSLVSALLHLAAAAVIVAAVWPKWWDMTFDTMKRINWQRRHQNYAPFRDLRELDEVCPPGSAILCHPYYAYNVLLATRRVFPIAVDAMHMPYTAVYCLDPGKRLDDLLALFTTSDSTVVHRILDEYQTRYVLLDDQTATAKLDYVRFMGGVEVVARSEREGWSLVRFPESPVPPMYRVRHFSPKTLAAGNPQDLTLSFESDRRGNFAELTGLSADYLGFSPGKKVAFPISHENDLAFVGIRYINYGVDGEFTLRLVPADPSDGAAPEIKIAYGPSRRLYYPAYSRATWRLPETVRGARYDTLVIESGQPESEPAVVDQIVLVEGVAPARDDERE